MTAGPILERRDGVAVYGNYIGGTWSAAASGETSENRNPANPDELIGHFPASASDDVSRAVAAAD